VLARIAAREPEVRAWTHLDPEHALEAARRLDAHQATGAPLGPLHGVPVGLKDIIDTADYPTENGTVLDAGRRPVADAVVAARLRAAGAVILGKTVTTELAVFHPGRTRNPHNPEHTPGGSSSGSAAAVAAAMVPLAVGTQTNGSMIRPAAFCGVVGFKPSRGTIPRGGVLNQSQTLDQIGVFARSAADAAFAADVLSGPDASDPATAGRLKGGLRAIAEAGPPVPPRFAFVRTPVWDHAEAETRAGLESLVGALGDSAEEVELPEAFARVHGWHRAINMAEIAANYDRYYERGRDRLSAILLGMIEEGRGVLARDYLHALAGIGRLNAVLAETLAGFDAVLTPSAPGPAPKGLEATGNPTFCTIWSYLGVPAVSLPLLRSPGGLPIGVQLVGAAGDDARLLRTAGWLERFAGSAGT
jgi:Asp-tRNA(Asn)/Glu-tRNA(Gln) amidotransferase A subunit family amidase